MPLASVTAVHAVCEKRNPAAERLDVAFAPKRIPMPSDNTDIGVGAVPVVGDALRNQRRQGTESPRSNGQVLSESMELEPRNRQVCPSGRS